MLLRNFITRGDRRGDEALVLRVAVSDESGRERGRLVEGRLASVLDLHVHGGGKHLVVSWELLLHLHCFVVY